MPALDGNSFTDAENDALIRAIEAVGFHGTLELLKKLGRKCRVYGRTGFMAAAAIARAWSKVKGKAHGQPESDRWILAVVENEFAGDPRFNPAGEVHQPAAGRSLR